MSTNTIQKRPGGRSAAVLSSIKVAVEELVAEKGRERVTIPMVAERAGVNPTSVYRRWGDLQTMINDIATYRLDPSRPIPELGSLKADLTEWAREIVEHYRNPTNAALLRGGAASAGENESDCTRNRRAEAGMIVERYGDSSPITPDDVLNHLVAPIIYRVIFLPWTLDDTTADSLVEVLFSGR
jgi:AcrR family transcriptional regulator